MFQERKNRTLVSMKPTGRINFYLKYTGIIIILVFLALAYGCKDSKPSPIQATKVVKASTAGIFREKKVARGASCCKASFSRTKMLSVKNSNPNIAPERK